MSNFRSEIASDFRRIQDQICSSLERIDGTGKFKVDAWERSDVTGAPGGGGISRVLAGGSVFEKAGVNFSEVHGFLPPDFAEKLGLGKEQLPFFATGVSLVIHPENPMVPTTHSNWRFLEAGPYSWFGGGSDLTPYILFDQDALHFHSQLKAVCDRHDSKYYPEFKKWCDEYFFLPHRKEHRGIGGIFFDHLGKDGQIPIQSIFPFVSELGHTFTECYIPIVRRTCSLPFTVEDKTFQLQRRGRYVEFNLLYDRGTHFGLNTGGRTESILMSLPPMVRWDYNPDWSHDSRYQDLLAVIRQPREWITL